MAVLVQWNVNGLNNRYEILQALIKRKNADIICIQETNLKNDETIQIKNFTTYNKSRKDCTAASGGVGIIVNNKLFSQPIQINTELEAVAVKVVIENKNICICNIYLSHKYLLKLSDIQELIDELPQPFVNTF